MFSDFFLNLEDACGCFFYNNNFYEECGFIFVDNSAPILVEFKTLRLINFIAICEIKNLMITLREKGPPANSVPVRQSQEESSRHQRIREIHQRSDEKL